MAERMAVDKARLLAPRAETASGLPEDDVVVPGFGSVRVRGLSRAEVLRTREDGRSEFEIVMLALGMVDPAMSEAEVAQWRTAAPAGELKPVTEAILALSGMGPDADKEASKSVRGDAGAGVGALPGPEAVDDSGQTAAGHAG